MSYGPSFARAPLSGPEQDVLEDTKLNLPDSLRDLMACKNCRKMRPPPENGRDGQCSCGSDDFTKDFEGYMMITNPEKSYFAKSQGIREPGCYAVRVNGGNE
uniref:Spt4/RpoE2 zinc finger domain-containing protein n=1 Tax=Palpitomonas bilix TaxID=652834 RepID=A0A7S3DDG5_9EUKA|mmetsp:Transcript_32840/g.84823  ORF Transcript_32840/g.84823 Transcript_32840/m.84823 type:complete len:102 (+) Transcript_32840:265-570(+)|eukprot:CAMPEP_0113867254 /NCGR_PEP_ID=MMETSP0780_2-20120614/319_1 /TAXON_ID=652834 /ORGANISM="Palpitomonas bilix" /LENGTH=101 /DNA_ID=CAMNT_0000852181 /DNA_START=78 /DNA_END=383 /DNA_ORIENTATION=- /assembly_acc=CAM_ASM_000599